MSEDEGIQAIIYLQGLAGITETRESAIQGWRSMTVSERAQTLQVYKLLKG